MSHFLEQRSDEPSRLDDRLYAQLKRAATACLRGERADHTLGPTDLVHEACLRLQGIGASDATSAEEIRRLAARAMRRVLVDHARRRSTAKRDAGRRVVADEPIDYAVARDEYVTALDGALVDLAEYDDELVAVVELLFFGGCTVEETAKALDLSPRTVKRRWSLAKGWLHREITDHARR